MHRLIHKSLRTTALRSLRSYHASVLPSIISTVSPEFKAKAAAMDGLVKDIEEKMSVTRQGGGQKAAERMRSKGKLLPRERSAMPLGIIPTH